MERVGGWPVQHLRYKRPGVLTVVAAAAAGREADVKNNEKREMKEEEEEKEENKKKNHLSRFSNFFFFFFPFGRQTREGRICIQSVTEPTFQQSQAPHVLSFKKGKENTTQNNNHHRHQDGCTAVDGILRLFDSFLSTHFRL